MDKKLLDILVCPQCKGSLGSVDGGNALHCRACRLKFPVRDGVPIMLIDEAAGEGHVSSTTTPIATFRIISGANKGLSFHLERLTCKALGRAMSDPNKTARFNVDVSLSLDEGTKGLIENYVGRQFNPKAPKGKGSETGPFKRTSDVVLDDTAISRLHAMLFYSDAGVGVLDLVSKNGTFVNGEEIESRLLRKGDAIEMGETKIIYEG